MTRKYDWKTLRIFSRGITLRKSRYLAFPGAVPIRLYIRVGILNPKTAKTIPRYTYNGKWSWLALRAAYKVYKALPSPLRGSCVIEYDQNGALYVGDFDYGTAFPAWRTVKSLTGLQKSEKSQRVTYDILPFKPVRVNSHEVIMGAPRVDESALQFYQRCKDFFRQNTDPEGFYAKRN